MKQITLEEYQTAIQTLNSINQEKIYLQQHLQHQSQEKNSLNTLLLQLTKENNQLDRQINLEIKILLEPYALSKKVYTNLETYLHNFINQLLLNLPIKEKAPFQLISLPTLNQFLTQITTLINQKRNNLILQQTILNLQLKEEQALIIKNKYIKQNKPKSLSFFPRKKRTN